MRFAHSGIWPLGRPAAGRAVIIHENPEGRPFEILGNEVKAEPSKWDGLGLRGNQSGTLEVDNVKVGPDRMVGPKGDGASSNDECVDPFFLLCSSACWNGISMGLIDIAKAEPRVKVVEFNRNYGQHSAIFGAFAEVEGQVVGFTLPPVEGREGATGRMSVIFSLDQRQVSAGGVEVVGAGGTDSVFGAGG